MKESEIMTETNKNTKNITYPTTSKIMHSKNQTLYIITIYHTTNTVLIQGSQNQYGLIKNFQY